MAGWKECLLGDVVNLKRGYDLPHNARSPGPFPVVSSSGITDHHSEAKVKGPGVVTGRYGSLGQVFFVESDYWPLNTSLYVQDFKGNDPRFVSYFLGTLNFGSQNAAGAVPCVNRNHLHAIEVRVPPPPIQQRIAGILSAYDELIENSQRRIKILEAMARALYREWFVHFRFPGHESHPRVPSPLGEIPNGWEVKPFSTIAKYVNGYAFTPADWGENEKPIIKIREFKAGVTTETPRNSGDSIPDKFNVRDGDILFSWSADLDAYLWMGGEGLLNQHLFNVIPFDGLARAFCFYALKEAMPRFRALSLGATMHHIKRSALDQVSAVVPTATIRQRFENVVEPMHGQLIALTKQVQNLRRTRDLLLPRLLSGQIDVEALPEGQVS